MCGADIACHLENDPYTAGTVVGTQDRLIAPVLIGVVVGPWACIVMGGYEYPPGCGGVEARHNVAHRHDVASMGRDGRRLREHGIGTVTRKFIHDITGTLTMLRCAGDTRTESHLTRHISVGTVGIELGAHGLGRTVAG